MTRPVSEHDQPHIRSPLMTAAPTSRLRRARAQEDENHSRKRRFRPWLASVRLPGSARTDQVLEDNGILFGVFVKGPSSWLARKLLAALWKYGTTGVVIEGAPPPAGRRIHAGFPAPNSDRPECRS